MIQGLNLNEKYSYMLIDHVVHSYRLSPAQLLEASPYLLSQTQDQDKKAFSKAFRLFMAENPKLEEALDFARQHSTDLHLDEKADLVTWIFKYRKLTPQQTLEILNELTQHLSLGGTLTEAAAIDNTADTFRSFTYKQLNDLCDLTKTTADTRYVILKKWLSFNLNTIGHEDTLHFVKFAGALGGDESLEISNMLLSYQAPRFKSFDELFAVTKAITLGTTKIYSDDNRSLIPQALDIATNLDQITEFFKYLRNERHFDAEQDSKVARFNGGYWGLIRNSQAYHKATSAQIANFLFENPPQSFAVKIILDDLVSMPMTAPDFIKIVIGTLHHVQPANKEYIRSLNSYLKAIVPVVQSPTVKELLELEKVSVFHFETKQLLLNELIKKVKDPQNLKALKQRILSIKMLQINYNIFKQTTGQAIKEKTQEMLGQSCRNLLK